MDCTWFLVICCLIFGISAAAKKYQELAVVDEDKKLLETNPEAWLARKKAEALAKEAEERAKDRNHNTALNAARIGAWFFKNW